MMGIPLNRLDGRIVAFVTEVLGGIGDPRTLYALPISEEMPDGTIIPGDLVIVRRQEEANEGDICLLYRRDKEQVLVRRIYRESGQVRLESINPGLAPEYSDPEDVVVQGRPVLMLRLI